jgi:hypothetical protein
MLSFLSLGAFVSWAQETTPTPVKIRAARHQDSVRVVFTTEDFLVKNVSVILTKNKTIRIDLHSAAAAAAAGRENNHTECRRYQGFEAPVPPEDSYRRAFHFSTKGGSCPSRTAKTFD